MKHFIDILGHWLGNQSMPIFTVIDTPGFGNDLVEEERTIEGKQFDLIPWQQPRI